MLLWWHELISSCVSVLDLVSLRCTSVLFVSWKGPQWLMLFTHLQISQLWWCCGFVVAVLLSFFSFWNLKSCFDFCFSKWCYILHFFILKCVHVSSLLFSNLIIIFFCYLKYFVFFWGKFHFWCGFLEDEFNGWTNT